MSAQLYQSLRIAVLLIALGAAYSPQLSAQTEDVDPFHWAYAIAFGSGVYRLSDGTEARVLRGNFSAKLRDAPELPGSGPGLRLLLPVAVGVQELDEDLLPAGRPADELEMAAFLPGLELEHRLGERWTVRSRAQFGRAKELEGTEQSARVATLGVRGRTDFDSAPGSPALITGLLWAGFDPTAGQRRSVLRLTAGVELDIPAARWRVRDGAMRWRPHVLKDWYYRPPDALAPGETELEGLGDEWQIGIAAAREDDFKILFWKVEAVGLAYRFSEHSSGWRIYLNSVF
jgi:hypothetical protein